MVDPILALSLIGLGSSIIWWMIGLSALNTYAASLGLNPRHVPFGKIWQDTQNPAYPHLIGFFVSTGTVIACLSIAMATGHSLPPPSHHLGKLK